MTGQARIDWAARFMPVMARMIDDLSLSGVSLGICLPADPKMGAMVRALSDAGANVRIAGEGDAGVVEALAAAGIGGLDCSETLLIGATAEDLRATHGLIGATAQDEGYAAEVPIIDLSASALNLMHRDELGTGQSSVMAFVDITNLQLAGRCVVVIGYDRAGRSVATHAVALGGRVTVVEHDPFAAAQALCDGHEAQSFDAALGKADVVFATSDTLPLTPKAARLLPNGALICAAGLGRLALEPLGPAHPVREHVTEVRLAPNHTVKIIADGAPVHRAAAEAHPIEVADIEMALHIAALGELMRGNLPPGPQPLSDQAQAKVACAKIAASGGTLEVLV